MKVNQLKEGTRVSLESIRENAKISLETDVCKFSDAKDIRYLNLLKERYPGKEYCFLNPIRQKQYLINFSSERVVNNLVFIKDQSPFAWEGVTVINTSFPSYGRVHMVLSSRQELPHNRRNSFRLKIAKPGDFIFKHKANDYRKEITINNISASGVGLITDTINGIEVGMPCKIAFVDGSRFRLNATVKRIQPLSDNRYIIGCCFDRPSEAVGKFVLQKQRAQRQFQKYA